MRNEELVKSEHQNENSLRIEQSLNMLTDVRRNVLGLLSFFFIDLVIP